MLRLNCWIGMMILSGGLLAEGLPWENGFFGDGVAIRKAAASFEVSEEDPVTFLYIHRQIEVDGEGRFSQVDHYLYRVENAQGVEYWGGLEESWSPWYQNRPEMMVRVLHPDGGEAWLDPNTITEQGSDESSPLMFDDRRTLRGPLPLIAEGAIVEVKKVGKEHAPYFSAGSIKSLWMAAWVPIMHSRVDIKAPKSLPLEVRLQDYEAELKEVKKKGQRLWTLEARNIPSLDDLDESPILRISTGQTWEKVASAYGRKVDEVIAKSKPLPRLDENLEGIAQVDELVDQMRHQVRYTGLELGQSSLIPEVPSTILERGYGDCKDQSTVLVSRLREAGFKAWVALLNSGYGDPVDKTLPGLGHFNHAIVYVENPPLWIDPTDPFSRLGEVPSSDQGRWALIARSGQNELVEIPESTVEDNLQVELREVFMVSYGHGRVVETTTLTGDRERFFRGNADASNRADRRETYSGYVERVHKAKALGKFLESEPFDFSESFELTLEALESGRVESSLVNAVVTIPIGSLSSNLPNALMDEDSEQKEVLVAAPYRVQWNYVIHPPVGMVPTDLPEPRVLKMGALTLEEGPFRWEEGVLRADFSLTASFRRLEGKILEETRLGIAEWMAEKETVFSFFPQGKLLAEAGEPVKALGHYITTTKNNPEDIILWIRWYRALNELGLSGEAKRLAGEIAEKFPNESLAWWVLGHSHLLDDGGQQLAPGSDWAAALNALEKAVELDSELPLPSRELAIALEYDAEGNRFENPDGLGRAAALLEGLFEKPVLSDLGVNYLLDLYYGGNYEKFLKKTKGKNLVEDLKVLRIAAIHKEKGLDQGLREVRAMATGAEARAALLVRAGQQFASERDYSTAEVLTRKAARMAENPAQVEALADLWGRIVPFSEIELSDDDPVSPIKKLLLMAAGAEISFEDIVSPAILRVDPKAEPEAYEESLRVLEGVMLGLEGEWLSEKDVELLAARMEVKVEGEEAFKKVTILFPGMEAPSVFWTRKEGGEYFILGSNSALSYLGKLAEDRLAEGDVDGARTYLLAVRESLPKVLLDDPYGPNSIYRMVDPREASSEELADMATVVALTLEPDLDHPRVPELLARLERPDALESLVAGWYVNQALVYPELAALSRTMVERHPDSYSARMVFVTYRIENALWGELRPWAEQELLGKPGDPLATLALAFCEYYEGHHEALEPLFAKMNLANMGNYGNQVAWYLLYLPGGQRQALEVAIKAAEQSDHSVYAIENTVAAAYAEMDRPLEANQILKKSLEHKPGKNPALDSADYYVLGRIAETYELWDLAKGHYEKALDLDEEDRAYWSVDRLVQRRLAPLKDKEN